MILEEQLTDDQPPHSLPVWWGNQPNQDSEGVTLGSAFLGSQCLADWHTGNWAQSWHCPGEISPAHLPAQHAMRAGRGEGQAAPKLYLIGARREGLQPINSSDPQKQDRTAAINSRNQYHYRSEGSRFKCVTVTLEAQETRHQRSQSANLNSFRNYLSSDTQF